jgi:hypothetical protein
MGAYGSPDLPPLRPPAPLRADLSSHQDWSAWTGHEHQVGDQIQRRRVGCPVLRRLRTLIAILRH